MTVLPILLETDNLTYGLDRGKQAFLKGTTIVGSEAWLTSYGKGKYRLTDNQGRMRKEVHVELRPGFVIQTALRYIENDLVTVLVMLLVAVLVTVLVMVM